VVGAMHGKGRGSAPRRRSTALLAASVFAAVVIVLTSTSLAPRAIHGPGVPGWEIVAVSWLRAHGFGPAINGIDTWDDTRDARAPHGGAARPTGWLGPVSRPVHTAVLTEG
jgi:hypothetical protein